MEGKDGVPLRFPRPVMALIATGMAAISLGLSAVPASADQVRQQEWWLRSLGVTAAWTTSQGSGVTVAVLSDGINASAADLSGAVTAAPAAAGGPVASGQYLGEQGTPIASLIAGRGHGPAGGSGIIGVAPRARILSVPVTLPPNDPQLAQSAIAAAIPGAIAAGIRYAVGHGATVIDLPIDPGQATSSGASGAAAAAGGSAAERAAIGYAIAHNVILVAPAGDNEAAGDALNYPAAYQGVIAVGAFGSAFNKAPWSSHQRYVTLMAAGAGVVAADNAGGYQTMNSTGAASAVVSGVVALIRSRYPSLTGAEVRQVLLSTTTYRRPGGLANGSGYGAVNAGKAMTAAAALATPPASRASARALPRQAAPAAPGPASAQGIGAHIARAADISGGLLVLLLLLVAAYGLTGRRRPRGQPAVAAEWMHRHGQSRYPQAGSTDADRMLELFAAPAPAPREAMAAEAPRRERYSSGGSWSGGGDGVFAPAASRDSGAPSAGQRGGFGGEPTVGGVGGGWLSRDPASRAVDRRTSVSGTPPWEPADAPDGELPWATAPGPSAGGPPAGGPVRRAPASDEPTWDAPARVVQSDRPESVRPGQPAYAADVDHDFVGRPDQFNRELTARGFGSAADASPPGDYLPAAGSGALPGPPAAGGYRSPTGSGAPAGFESLLDYSSPGGYDSGIDRGATASLGYRDGGGHDRSGEFDVPTAPRVAPSGLPVRQPRASRPPGSAPLSPSGSLWEPASRDAGEPADYQDQSYDSAGRPIFVWDPAANRGSRETGSSE
jgi:hypothetical protein